MHLPKFKLNLIVFLGALLLSLLWFRNGNLMGTGESGLPFYDMGYQLKTVSYSWNEEMLGNSSGFGIAGLPHYKIFAYISDVIGNNAVTEALFFFLTLLVSGIATGKYVSLLIQKIDSKWLCVSVIFYWFNPFTLVNVWNRFLYNYMVFYALLPVFMYLFVKGLRAKKYVYAIITSILTVLFAFSFTLTPFIILLLSISVLVSLIYTIVYQTGFRFFAVYNLLFIFSFVLVNSWWIVTFVVFATSAQISSTLNLGFSSSGNLSVLEYLSSDLGDIRNVIRLHHGSFFLQGDTLWKTVFESIPIKILEYTLFGTIFYFIYKNVKQRKILFLSSFFVLVIFFTKGVADPLGEIFKAGFIHISPLQVFRNPFEKIGFLLPISLTPLIAYSFSKLDLSNRKHSGLAIVNSLTILVVFTFPFFSTYVFTYKNSNDSTTTYEVDVPTEYQEFRDIYRDKSDDKRLLVLPLADVGMNYVWDHAYGGVEISNPLFQIPNISSRFQIPYYSQIVNQLENYLLTSTNDDRILNDLNIGYVLVRKDIDWKGRGVSDPAVFINKYEADPSYKRIESNDIFDVYKWLAASKNNKIFARSVYSTAEGGIRLNNYDYVDDEILLSYSHENLPDNPVSEIVNATYIGPISTVETLGPEDAYARLLYAKYLRDEPYKYKISEAKQRIKRFTLKQKEDVFIHDIQLVGKIAVEIYRSLIEGRALSNIDDANEYYLNSLNKFVELHKSEIAYTPENNNWKLFIDELNKHKTLFSSLSSGNVRNSVDEIDKLLRVYGYEVEPLIYNKTTINDFILYKVIIPEDGTYEMNIKNIDSLSQQQDQSFLVDKNIYKLDFDQNNILALDLEEGEHTISIPDYWEPSDYDNKIVDNNNSKYKIPVDMFDNNSVYKLSFDYWIKRGDTLNVLVNLDNSYIPHAKKKLSADSYNRYFQHDEMYIYPDQQASKMDIMFGVDKYDPCNPEIVDKPSYCNKSEDHTVFQKDTEVELKYIQLKRLFNNEITFTKRREANRSLAPIVTYTQLSPVEYKVQISNAVDPYLLVFSELFDDGWKIYDEDENQVYGDKHLVANMYANSWFINREGDYEFTLYHHPQKVLEKGKKVSVVSIIALILLSVYLLYRSKSKNE